MTRSTIRLAQATFYVIFSILKRKKSRWLCRQLCKSVFSQNSKIIFIWSRTWVCLDIWLLTKLHLYNSILHCTIILVFLSYANCNQSYSSANMSPNRIAMSLKCETFKIWTFPMNILFNVSPINHSFLIAHKYILIACSF